MIKAFPKIYLPHELRNKRGLFPSRALCEATTRGYANVSFFVFYILNSLLKF